MFWLFQQVKRVAYPRLGKHPHCFTKLTVKTVDKPVISVRGYFIKHDFVVIAELLIKFPKHNAFASAAWACNKAYPAGGKIEANLMDRLSVTDIIEIRRRIGEICKVRKVRIHSVAIGRESQLLKWLAKDTGGQYVQIL